MRDAPNTLLAVTGEYQLFDMLSQLKTLGVTMARALHRSGVIGLADKVMGRMAIGKPCLQIAMVPASMGDLTAWIGAQFTRAGDKACAQTTILVVTEMVNIALANGPSHEPRKSPRAYAFQSDIACQLRLSEPPITSMVNDAFQDA